MTKPKMMTQSDKAKAYDGLRQRAGEKGYACIDYAIEAAPHRLMEPTGVETSSISITDYIKLNRGLLV